MKSKINIERGCMLVLLSAWLAVSCNDKKSTESYFKVLSSDQTGLQFANKLTPTNDFNLFDYMYYYNGSGIAAGDFNNDGLIDVFFAANQGSNKIFLNQADLKFRDVTEMSKIPQDGAWSTGVSVVDINNDGLLDLYISRVGNYKVLEGKNQFLICQSIGPDGIPVYKDMASEFGLDYSGFSTQAAFLDIDMDGDLDMFLLNHSVHENGVYRPRREFLGVVHSVAGARMFRNDDLKFTDITASSGINSSVIGYGLGIAISDINMDGYPDIYIGNDFHENDYLYINNGKGVFKEDITNRIGHTSRFSMGVDIADLTNDGHSEIISMDMLSDDPYILKRSLGEDDYDIFNLKISYGYQHQYSRNNLQLNRGNGSFIEAGVYAGIAATDWSWSPLFMDFDNDGLKDLFISNGIPKRMNDIDYINFVSNEEMQRQLAPGNNGGDKLKMIERFPKIKVPDKFFRNSGSLNFEDIGSAITGAVGTYSNGAVYADFDNDGDLDIIVNTIDEPALLYQNNSGSRNDSASNASLQVHLIGDSGNIRAIGAKVIVYTDSIKQMFEKFSVHGFQSSMETPIHVGLGKSAPDSIIVVWPDNTFELVASPAATSKVDVLYRRGLPKFDYSRMFAPPLTGIEDITNSTGLIHRHEENVFAEFNREPLLPHMLSTEGPALAVGDMNDDGLEDVFIGAARGKKSSLWLQTQGGKFTASSQPSLEADSIYEDISAIWSDVDGDGLKDLLVASGGNEFFGESSNLSPRLYLNKDGKLQRKPDAFPAMYMTGSVIAASDFNGDGFIDVFVGGRAIPMDYGIIPPSFLLANDGKGNFRNVTASAAPELQTPGFVTSATWTDMDKDGDPDLLVTCEWDGLLLFTNNGSTFTLKKLSELKGWWNFMLPVDVDNDGDLDIIAGNLGLNSRVQASQEKPVTMYHYDFDDNGRKEQLLTYFVREKEVPFASFAELSKQMPFIKKKFLYAGDFANAKLQDIFDPKTLRAASKYTADYFSSVILINNGTGQFEMRALPWEAQLTPYRDAVIINANGDNLPDILLTGNYFDSNTEIGRHDGEAVTLLINRGSGNFSVQRPGFPWLSQAQARHAANINLHNGSQNIVVATNNDSVRVLQIIGNARKSGSKDAVK